MTLPTRLTPDQRDAIRRWCPGAEVVSDHSWGLTDTTVLHLRCRGQDVIVKAGGPHNHHIDREIAAHPAFTEALVEAGGAARLLRAEPAARLLVLEHLPGELVEGTDAEWLEDTYRQAGALLATLHAQGARLSADHEARADARAHEWLDGRHRIDAATVGRLRAALDEPDTPGPTTLVPTHGDWQPRNWLVDAGRVRVIDFGRADWRPAATDLARLAAQQFVERPALEKAFLDGYGKDPREPVQWRKIRVREAIGTASWAHQVGDLAFEQQGHRMIREVLAEPVGR